jgi:Flp pilus assembly protein TadG
MLYLHRRVKSEKAAVMPLFAISLLPILFLGAMVVDITRVSLVNTQLAYACDAAAIAAVRYNATDMTANATKLFYANYRQGSYGVNVTPTITIAPDNSYVEVSAQAQSPVLFNKLLGRNFLNVSGYSKVRRELASSQIALVLDVTGSMAYNGKIDGLRTAATNLVNTIFENNATLPNIAISIVPYIATVNIGPQHTSWISNPSQLSFFPSNNRWEGCVGAVDTGSNDDTDAPPSLTRKWPVYYAESTYGALYSTPRDNDWGLNADGTLRVYQSISGINVGPNRSCAPSLVALTNVKQTLINKINTFTLSNIRYGAGTFGNLGIVWGWNTISPRWTGLWDGPVQPANNNVNSLKSIVIVTDGENNWTDQPGYNPLGDPITYAMTAATVSLSNRTRVNTLGVTSVSAMNPLIDNRVTSLCTRIKNSGIQIFTVTFQVSSNTAKTLYTNCATKPEWAFQADSSQELYNHFSTIANQLKKITIIK